MILVWLIIIPLAGGILAWLAAGLNHTLARLIALAAAIVEFAFTIWSWVSSYGPINYLAGGSWIVRLQVPWIPQLGIHFSLAMDGLSLLMLVLTGFLGIIAVLASWRGITERVGFYHFNLMLILAGVVGVFLAVDLFLFYLFWELMLVPMYLMIDIWGHEHRHYAAVKFFIFTQLSGLLMLAAILGLYFLHGRATGIYTFEYSRLLGGWISPGAAAWLMLGFFAAFAVKLPAVPVHSWLPDAHTEAPTAGSILLAGLLLKTGAYGMIRFIVPLFPQSAAWFAPAAMVLAVIGIIYAAIVAFGQTDLKRLVAFTSISHLGFVMLGIFAWNKLALEGAVIQMICHGLSTGALFMLVGALQDRIHTRDMRRMGGLWAQAPRLGGTMMFFGLASLGLPGLGNFVGEFLVLLGVYRVSLPLTVLATGGLIVSTVYALWMIQAVFFGPSREKWQLPDLGFREMTAMAMMMVALIWLGLLVQPVLNTAGTALAGIQQAAISSGPAWISGSPPTIWEPLPGSRGGLRQASAGSIIEYHRGAFFTSYSGAGRRWFRATISATSGETRGRARPPEARPADNLEAGGPARGGTGSAPGGVTADD